MVVTKKMLNSELRSSYWPFTLLTVIMRKAWGIRLVNFLMRLSKGKSIGGLHCEERYIPSRNSGPEIRIRIFKPLNYQGDLPGMLYLHGGGYMLGVPEMALPAIKGFIKSRACVIVAPDYRKSSKNPYPAGFNDCYDTLLWIQENSQSLGITSNSFIIGGHSAGGGLTAAVTLKARDTKDVDIAFQMPIYPMLDDRQNTESAKDMSTPVWNSKTNAKGWELYLKDLKDKNVEIPAYAAAVRNSDYTGFPPTITFVADLEPFRDETIAYVETLKKAGIPVAFELFEGCYHGFEALASKTAISKQATRFLMQSYEKFYDQAFAQLLS